MEICCEHNCKSLYKNAAVPSRKLLLYLLQDLVTFLMVANLLRTCVPCFSRSSEFISLASLAALARATTSASPNGARMSPKIASGAFPGSLTIVYESKAMLPNVPNRATIRSIVARPATTLMTSQATGTKNEMAVRNPNRISFLFVSASSSLIYFPIVATLAIFSTASALIETGIPNASTMSNGSAP
jgi:hypothetical protein